jgi:hypothetical protein
MQLAQANTGRETGAAPQSQGSGPASGAISAPAANAPAGRAKGGESRNSGGGRSNDGQAMTRQRIGGDAPSAKGRVERRTIREREVDKPRTKSRPAETQRARVNKDRDGDRDRNRRRGTRFYWGPGAEYFFFDGFYHGDCSWLRRKARETGSRYWLQRYRQCRAW